MCRFISFWHNPNTGDIKVSDLTSHSETAEALGLADKVWREGHYLPNGTVECRVLDTDRKTSKECEARLLSKWPTFIEFWEMCIEKGGVVNRSLDLGGCTGLKSLPKNLTVKGSLGLRGCTGLKFLPENLKVNGYLDLSGCTGLKSLPKNLKVNGYLDLSDCPALKSLPENLNVNKSLDLPNHLKETG